MDPERICIRVIDLGPIKIEEGSDLAVSQLPLPGFNDSALFIIVSLGKLADSTRESGIYYSVECLNLVPSTIVPPEKLSNSTSRSSITSSGNFPNPTPLSNNSYTQKVVDSTPKSSNTYSGEHTDSNPTSIIVHPSHNSYNPQAQSLSLLVSSKEVDSTGDLRSIDSSLGTSVTDSITTSSILDSCPKYWQAKDTIPPKIPFAKLMESATASSALFHPPTSSAGPSTPSTIATHLYALKNAIFNTIEAKSIKTLAKTEAKVQQLQTEINKDAEKLRDIYKEA
ncbi:unnamed protein product [Sphagnum balticum]